MNHELEQHPWQGRARGMLAGAAVGDALGWPHERRDRTHGALPEHEGAFLPWERMAGSRFRPFTEAVGEGDYSDDTQMTIAVGRALVRGGDEWLTWLQHVEWPFFLSYERGAGASVKRACRSWDRGRPPWSVGPKEAEKYFSSGANGAAMRIAPHVIRHCRDSGFDALAADVVRDAGTTHGHPRALLGAVVQAFGLWVSMRQPAPLSYGWLLEALRDGVDQWQQPWWETLPDEWQRCASQYLEVPVSQLWTVTVREVVELLTAAEQDLQEGAVSAPTSFLRAQGLTALRSRGSGTLCAVAAAYLASRFADSPERGVVTAAHLKNADTDTLASMTAGLLGAASGDEWLGSWGRSIQDRVLLRGLARSLLDLPGQTQIPPPTWSQARAARSEFSEQLTHIGPGQQIQLPDQRSAQVTAHEQVRAREWLGRRATLRTGDEQTLHVLHSVHRQQPVAEGARQSAQDGQGAAVLQGAYLSVMDAHRVRQALQDIFGLCPTRYGETWSAYGNLVLHEETTAVDAPPLPRAQLRVTVQDPSATWKLAQAHGLRGTGNERQSTFQVDLDPYLTVLVNTPAERRVRRAR